MTAAGPADREFVYIESDERADGGGRTDGRKAKSHSKICSVGSCRRLNIFLSVAILAQVILAQAILGQERLEDEPWKKGLAKQTMMMFYPILPQRVQQISKCHRATPVKLWM